MGRIAVKIVSDGANTSGGRADSMMLTQYASDVVRVPDDIAASECSGGILPITQAEYDLLGLATASASDILLEDGTWLLLESNEYLLLEA